MERGDVVTHRVLLTAALLSFPLAQTAHADGGAIVALVEAPSVDAPALREMLSQTLGVPVVGLGEPIARMVERRLLVTAGEGDQVTLLFEEPQRGRIVRTLPLLPESENVPSPLLQLHAASLEVIYEASRQFIHRSEVIDPFRGPLLSPAAMTEVLDPFPEIPRTVQRVRLSSEVIDPFDSASFVPLRSAAVLDPWRGELAEGLSAPSPTP